ncbi:unnamed protein product [Polarella glacialis]|uniref:Uncharacterized protein n=1 Tax=Polarella glacialis TaxID=89957 RepID=A0A813HSY2_POLGL|nr:unnamed protein product [Polarella glacialis]CAE8715945.1 unnamed protein product [Polarella glacialis]
MIGALPVYKWLLMANPFTHKLEEVYISQWSDPLDANGDMEIDSQDQKIAQQTLRDVVCRSLLADKNRYIIDAWPFSGYHQYPPPGRRSRTMAGIQFWNVMSAPAFSHSTLPYDVPEHVPRSPSAAWGLLIVYIQWWNPFYPYTGWRLGAPHVAPQRQELQASYGRPGWHQPKLCEAWPELCAVFAPATRFPRSCEGTKLRVRASMKVACSAALGLA